MVANFLAGGAVVNAFARQLGVEVRVVDVGVAAPLDAVPGLRPRRVVAGTADMTERAGLDPRPGPARGRGRHRRSRASSSRPATAAS